MKKSLIYSLIFLFAIQIAFAGITIDDFSERDYNLGDEVNLRGEVYYEETIFGAMKVDLYCGEETLPVYFSLLNLDAGEVHEFNLDIPTRESLMGNCNFLVTVEGASEEFEKSSDVFGITDSLRLEAHTNVLIAKPGDIITISGNAYKINGDVVEDGRVTIFVDGEENLAQIRSGAFTRNIALQDDAKSGKHEVEVNVEDANGNTGEDDASFKIEAIPGELEIMMENSYDPSDTVTIEVLLYDQADEFMDGNVVIEIYNPNNELEESLNVESSETFGVELDSLAIPGSWSVKAKSFDLMVLDNFLVNVAKDIETRIEDGILTIRNSGNVDYSDPIEVKLSGTDDAIIVKETTLKPNQTIEIDLSEEVKYSGDYSVEVGGSLLTGNVVLEGKKKTGGTYLGWIAVMFVFVFFIYMVMKKGVKFAKKGTKKIKNKITLEKTETKEDKIKQEDINFLVNKVKNDDNVEVKDSSNDKNMFKIFD